MIIIAIIIIIISGSSSRCCFIITIVTATNYGKKHIVVTKAAGSLAWRIFRRSPRSGSSVLVMKGSSAPSASLRKGEGVEGRISGSLKHGAWRMLRSRHPYGMLSALPVQRPGAPGFHAEGSEAAHAVVTKRSPGLAFLLRLRL